MVPRLHPLVAWDTVGRPGPRFSNLKSLGDKDMDVIRTLRSILAPSAGPVNQARPAGPRPATPAGAQSFASALSKAANLEDPTIGRFGVLERPSRPAGGQSDPSIDPGRPTIIPAVPNEPTVDLPVVSLPIELRDTLETAILIHRNPVVAPKADPITPPGPRDSVPVVTEPKPPTPPPKNTSLPPIGVLWGPVAALGGSPAPGIAATNGQVGEMMQRKFDYYTQPARYGVSEGDEGRMFLAAVDRGYVPKTPEGLATLLSWNSMGDIDGNLKPTGRPVEISNFFSAWYHGTLTA